MPSELSRGGLFRTADICCAGLASLAGQPLQFNCRMGERGLPTTSAPSLPRLTVADRSIWHGSCTHAHGTGFIEAASDGQEGGGVIAQGRTRRRCVAADSIRARLVAVALTSLLATGCGMLNDPVEERWESRTEFSSCGEVSLDQGEEMQKQAAREILCLQRALKNGGSAELKVTYPTVEGDPVREYYRLTPQGRLEVYTDSTDDHYSDRKWSFAECYTPEWLAEISCGP